MLRRSEAPVVASKPGFRPDIEGLRALAVLLVVVNHLFGQPAGGFIGVDIFFVISGYLITGQLVRERTRTGWISLATFYAKRLRRIIPAATLVIAATAVASFAFWYLPRAGQAALDGLSALLWVSNWHFAGLGVDYLQASGPISPFQHYWSLSVEEQFYLFWPWLLLALPVVAAKSKKFTASGAMLSGMLAFAALSFAWAVVATRMLPTFAYFDTLSRGWEFALGSLVAIVPANRFAKFGRLVPMVGLIVIVAGALVITERTPFPGPWAIVPVVGTMMVIGGNASSLGPGMGILTNPVSRYVGRISYSLYLWHFPVIVFTAVLVPSTTWVSAGAALALATALSCMSFHFVEEPVRRSGWLRSWEGAAARSGERRKREILAAVALATVVLTLTAVQVRGPLFLREQSAATAAISDTPRMSAVGAVKSEDDLVTAVSEAATRTVDASTVTPSLNILGAGQQASSMDWATGCRNEPGTASPRVCSYGSADANKTAVVIGDSIAMSWMPAITKALPESWKVKGLGFASCTPYDIETNPVVPSATFASDCAVSKNRMLDFAAQAKPDLIVVSSHQYSLLSRASAESWGEAVFRTLTVLKSSGATIIVLPKPPAGADLRSCANRLTGLAACSTSLDPGWEAFTDAERRAVSDAKLSGIPAHFVEIKDWFCTRDDVCPPAIAGYVVRTDVGHLSNAYAESLAGVLHLQLERAFNGI